MRPRRRTSWPARDAYGRFQPFPRSPPSPVRPRTPVPSPRRPSTADARRTPSPDMPRTPPPRTPGTAVPTEPVTPSGQILRDLATWIDATPSSSPGNLSESPHIQRPESPGTDRPADEPSPAEDDEEQVNPPEPEGALHAVIFFAVPLLSVTLICLFIRFPLFFPSFLPSQLHITHLLRFPTVSFHTSSELFWRTLHHVVLLCELAYGYQMILFITAELGRTVPTLVQNIIQARLDEWVLFAAGLRTRTVSLGLLIFWYVLGVCSQDPFLWHAFLPIYVCLCVAWHHFPLHRPQLAIYIPVAVLSYAFCIALPLINFHRGEIPNQDFVFLEAVNQRQWGPIIYGWPGRLLMPLEGVVVWLVGASRWNVVVRRVVYFAVGYWQLICLGVMAGGLLYGE